MTESLETDEIGLLLLIQRLAAADQPLDRATLLPLAGIKLPEVAQNYDRLVSALAQKGLITGDSERFTLTPAGEQAIAQAAREHSITAMFYDAYYQAVERSAAHSLFCRRVYGLDLAQHGMADMQQIETMLAELDLRAGMTFLDFGCGDGRITEHISDQTGVRGVGVDIAAGAIELAQRRTRPKSGRLEFRAADLEKDAGIFPPRSFDRVIAIDSLFFTRDQQKVFDIFFGWLKPGGRMAIFYICPPDTTAEKSVIGKILCERGISFTARDFSAENTAHWALKKQTLLELEPLFEAEGSLFLFKNRLAECGGLDLFHRSLYIIQTKE